MLPMLYCPGSLSLSAADGSNIINWPFDRYEHFFSHVPEVKLNRELEVVTAEGKFSRDDGMDFNIGFALGSIIKFTYTVAANQGDASCTSVISALMVSSKANVELPKFVFGHSRSFEVPVTAYGFIPQRRFKWTLSWVNDNDLNKPIDDPSPVRLPSTHALSAMAQSCQLCICLCGVATAV